MGYYIGDKPAADLVIDPLRDEEPVSLTPFNAVTATLYLDGELVPVSFTAAIDDQTIEVTWPATTPFLEAGIHELRLTLTSSTGASERLPAVYLVACNEDDGWHNLDSARNAWPDAPPYDAWLYELLDLAKEQVLTYAPALETGTRPPANYRKGQLMQARNLWNANRVDPATGGAGDESFVLQPFPLDWMVKQVLRPKPGVPRVG